MSANFAIYYAIWILLFLLCRSMAIITPTKNLLSNLFYGIVRCCLMLILTPYIKDCYQYAEQTNYLPFLRQRACSFLWAFAQLLDIWKVKLWIVSFSLVATSSFFQHLKEIVHFRRKQLQPYFFLTLGFIVFEFLMCFAWEWGIVAATTKIVAKFQVNLLVMLVVLMHRLSGESIFAHGVSRYGIPRKNQNWRKNGKTER